MNLMKKTTLGFFLILLSACANNQISKEKNVNKIFYSSSGFALIYEDNFYKQGVVSVSLNNEKVI